MATLLFVKRGYHQVTTAEIAQLAGVSVPTLFNYFPNKEALLFDEDVEQEEHLIASVVSRKKGTSILKALLDYGLKNPAYVPANRKIVRGVRRLIRTTPELSRYEQQIYMRYETSLARTLQQEARRKLGKVEAQSVAHFILDAFYRATDAPNPAKTLRALFDLLREGWAE